MQIHATKSTAYHRASLLIVEQEPGSSETACTALRAHNFEATVFKSGAYSSDRTFSDYDLLILEHKGANREVCLRILRRLREVTSVPIVVISDEQNSRTRIRALELGADEFMARPYANRELVARVGSILRRSGMHHRDIPAKSLHIDRQARQVAVHGRPVDLTQREFEILCVLASQPGRNFSRSEVLTQVWGDQYSGDPRRVDLYISRIRAKMHEPGSEDLILSVYGVGYRLETNF